MVCVDVITVQRTFLAPLLSNDGASCIAFISTEVLRGMMFVFDEQRGS